MNDREEYILQENNVLVVSKTEFDENGYPLIVEISYDEYDNLTLDI